MRSMQPKNYNAAQYGCLKFKSTEIIANGVYRCTTASQPSQPA